LQLRVERQSLRYELLNCTETGSDALDEIDEQLSIYNLLLSPLGEILVNPTARAIQIRSRCDLVEQINHTRSGCKLLAMKEYQIDTKI
jgi:hypothetical protein